MNGAKEMDTAFLLHLPATLLGMMRSAQRANITKGDGPMATTGQWLKMPYGQNANAVGSCAMPFGLRCQAGTLHVLLCASIASGLKVPVSWEVPPSSE
jgi:hypothetical protein